MSRRTFSAAASAVYFGGQFLHSFALIGLGSLGIIYGIGWATDEYRYRRAVDRLARATAQLDLHNRSRSAAAETAVPT